MIAYSVLLFRAPVSDLCTFAADALQPVKFRKLELQLHQGLNVSGNVNKCEAQIITDPELGLYRCSKTAIFKHMFPILSHSHLI
jgi:hypothetical protein